MMLLSNRTYQTAGSAIVDNLVAATRVSQEQIQQYRVTEELRSRKQLLDMVVKTAFDYLVADSLDLASNPRALANAVSTDIQAMAAESAAIGHQLGTAARQGAASTEPRKPFDIAPGSALLVHVEAEGVTQRQFFTRSGWLPRSSTMSTQQSVNFDQMLANQLSMASIDSVYLGKPDNFDSLPEFGGQVTLRDPSTNIGSYLLGLVDLDTFVPRVSLEVISG